MSPRRGHVPCFVAGGTAERGKARQSDARSLPQPNSCGPSGILQAMTGKLVPLVQASAPDHRADRRPFAELGDDELMLLVRGGRGSAFDELVRRHQRRVLGVAARYAPSAGQARDVAQNTFLELYRSVPRYQARGSFTSFLYSILLSQCRMAWRAVRADERRRAAAAMQLIDESYPETSEASILARERNRDVQRSLDRLTEKLRAVVVLRYSGDLSYQEIADVLGIPLGTVKRRLFDALDKLRDVMEEPS
jgi:RNA polymerase sigma factor (sigma-70 family)